MWKKLLVGTLIVAFVIESGLTFGGLLAPARALALFGVGVTTDTLFMAFVLGWLFLIITAVIGVALRDVRAGSATGWTLSTALGIWWLALGIVLAVRYGRIENLFMDSAKGAMLLLCARKSLPPA